MIKAPPADTPMSKYSVLWLNVNASACTLPASKIGAKKAAKLCCPPNASGILIKPPTIDNTAKTTSVTVIRQGDSCKCFLCSSVPRNLPKNVRYNNRNIYKAVHRAVKKPIDHKIGWCWKACANISSLEKNP